MAAPSRAERPGALTPEGTRALLVISASGDLAVALRERVDRGMTVIRDVRPGEVSEGLAACRPWPWMVVGDVSLLVPSLRATLWARPVIVLWRGATPSGLPGHTLACHSFATLADAVLLSLETTVGALRLAPGVGVDLANGQLCRSAELQALVSAHPRTFDLPLRLFRSSARALGRAGIPLRPGRVGTGGVGLVATGPLAAVQR